MALSDTFDTADHFLPLETALSSLDILTPGLPGLYGNLFPSLLMLSSILLTMQFHSCLHFHSLKAWTDDFAYLYPQRLTQ